MSHTLTTIFVKITLFQGDEALMTYDGTASTAHETADLGMMLGPMLSRFSQDGKMGDATRMELSAAIVG